MKYKTSNKLFSWYYVSIISLVLFIGIGATILTYKTVSLKAQKDLLLSVASIAVAFEPSDITNLTGTELDLNNQYYLSIKNKLEKIRGINEDVRFIYLWGYRENEIYFMVDSEPVSSPDYSPPGQIYKEATLVEKQVMLKELSSAIEFNSDRWGSWLTALVPIMEGDRVVAVMGMDMSSFKYRQSVYSYTAIPIVSTFFVLFIIIIGLVLRKKEEKYLKLKEDLIDLATHELRSPLTGISWLVDSILEDEDNIKNESRINLKIVSEKIKNLINNINKLLISSDKKEK